MAAKLALLLAIKSLQSRVVNRKSLSVYEITCAMKKYKDPEGIWEALKVCYPKQLDQVRVIAEMSNMREPTPAGFELAKKLCAELNINPISCFCCHTANLSSTLKLRQKAIELGVRYDLAVNLRRDYGMTLATDTFDDNLVIVGELYLRTGALRIPQHVQFGQLNLEHHGNEFHLSHTCERDITISIKGKLHYDSFMIYKSAHKGWKSSISCQKSVLHVQPNEKAAYEAWTKGLDCNANDRDYYQEQRKDAFSEVIYE